MSETFVYARIGRAGLGNNLVIWARAEVFASGHGLRVIAPHWSMIKIGPILRREPDWRLYGNLFRCGDDICGLQRRWLLLRATRSPGPAGFEPMTLPPRLGDRPHIIEFTYHSAHPPGHAFKPMGKILEPLIPYADFLHERLRQISKPAHLRVADSLLNEPFIGIHFRRGDKPPLPVGTLYPSNTDHPTLPTEWYVQALSDVRKKLGYDAKAVVFSDGRPDELRPLTSLPNVVVAPIHNALIDLLLLAKSSILITTLSSSFSRWAGILGKMPSVHYPGRSFQLVEGRPELTMFTALDGRLDDSTTDILQSAMPRSGRSDEVRRPLDGTVDATSGTEVKLRLNERVHDPKVWSGTRPKLAKSI